MERDGDDDREREVLKFLEETAKRAEELAARYTLAHPRRRDFALLQGIAERIKDPGPNPGLAEALRTEAEDVTARDFVATLCQWLRWRAEHVRDLDRNSVLIYCGYRSAKRFDAISKYALQAIDDANDRKLLEAICKQRGVLRKHTKDRRIRNAGKFVALFYEDDKFVTDAQRDKWKDYFVALLPRRARAKHQLLAIIVAVLAFFGWRPRANASQQQPSDGRARGRPRPRASGTSVARFIGIGAISLTVQQCQRPRPSSGHDLADQPSETSPAVRSSTVQRPEADVPLDLPSDCHALSNDFAIKQCLIDYGDASRTFPDQALKYYHEAIAHVYDGTSIGLMEIGDAAVPGELLSVYQDGVAYEGIASLNALLGNHDAAYESFKRVIEIRQKIPAYDRPVLLNLTDCSILLVLAHRALGARADVPDVWSHCARSVTDQEFPIEDIVPAPYELGQIWEELDDPERALYFYDWQMDRVFHYGEADLAEVQRAWAKRSWGFIYSFTALPGLTESRMDIVAQELEHRGRATRVNNLLLVATEALDRPGYGYAPGPLIATVPLSRVASNTDCWLPDGRDPRTARRDRGSGRTFDPGDHIQGHDKAGLGRVLYSVSFDVESRRVVTAEWQWFFAQPRVMPRGCLNPRFRAYGCFLNSGHMLPVERCFREEPRLPDSRITDWWQLMSVVAYSSQTGARVVENGAFRAAGLSRVRAVMDDIVGECVARHPSVELFVVTLHFAMDSDGSVRNLKQVSASTASQQSPMSVVHECINSLSDDALRAAGVDPTARPKYGTQVRVGEGMAYQATVLVSSQAFLSMHAAQDSE